VHRLHVSIVREPPSVYAAPPFVFMGFVVDILFRKGTILAGLIREHHIEWTIISTHGRNRNVEAPGNMNVSRYVCLVSRNNYSIIHSQSVVLTFIPLGNIDSQSAHNCCRTRPETLGPPLE
jgi:hypothetical protein